MDDGKEREQNKIKERPVATSLKQLDLRRCDDLFIRLGNYAHVHVMLGSSVNLV